MRDLAAPRYLRVQGYPALEVTIDGIRTRLGTDHRRGPLAAGLAYLGPDLEDAGPPVAYRDESGRLHALAGYTDDRRFVALYRAFLDAAESGAFAPGPVALPD